MNQRDQVPSPPANTLCAAWPYAYGRTGHTESNLHYVVNRGAAHKGVTPIPVTKEGIVVATARAP